MNRDVSTDGWVLPLTVLLIDEACQRLSEPERGARGREWIAEVYAILDDRGLSRWRRRARALRFVAGQYRTVARVGNCRAHLSCCVAAWQTPNMRLSHRKAREAESTTGVVVVSPDGLRQVATASFGMDLVQQVARLLGSEHIRSSKLGEQLTLWHAEDGPGRPRAGLPNPAASLLAAEYELSPVAGTAVVTGPLLYGSPYPLKADEAEQLLARLRSA